MSLDHWTRIKAVFEEAHRHPRDARAAYLDTACEGDETFRAEVERLLAADDEASAFFDTLGGALHPDDAVPSIPDAVGPWRTTRELGIGGMGQVIEAVRDDGLYDQRVALKLVRPGLAPALVERFRAERRLLAGLEHPRIARLLDGGVADDGRPYFAMEYVEGEPLFAHADAHRLGVEDRLRLFLGVCEAVAYAHRQLIVHRDLKPNNILVTAEGEPKLLDFGIAKLLDEEDGLTRTGQALMTPEYAAPEQITGGPVTTATDVYALGVLLYELLTGHRPYVFENHNPQTTARAVLEQDPGRPSTVVLETRERRSVRGETRTVTPEEVARRRATSAERLRRRLSGDLDTICLKALRKEPERRYASVEALAEDLRRHLDGLPVAARPDTFVYRARKFVRRHRAGVTAAALAVLALAVGLGAALWQADRAEAAAAAALAETDRAESVTQFMVDLFASADFSTQEEAATTAAEMLEMGVERAEAELGHRPETQAQVFNVVANIYTLQGDFERALPLSERALDLRRDLYGEDDVSVAESKANLGALHFSLRDVDQAEPLLREALDVRARHLGEQDSATVETRTNLGLVLWRKGDLDEARALLEQAAQEMRTLYSDTSTMYATVLNNLGLVYNQQEDYAAAEGVYREALSVFGRTVGLDHPNAGVAQMNLAKALGRQERYAEAESPSRASVEVLSGLAPDHPATLAARNYLGQLLTQLERYDEAEQVLLDSRAAAEARYGLDFQSTQTADAALAKLYDAWGRPDLADRYRHESEG